MKIVLDTARCFSYILLHSTIASTEIRPNNSLEPIKKTTLGVVGNGVVWRAFASTSNGAFAFAGLWKAGKTQKMSTIMKEKHMARIRTHPGDVLQEEFMVPLGLSARALGALLGVPANRLSQIARGRRDVSADTAIRLGRYFKTHAHFWLNLQAAHDLSKAESQNDYSSIAPRAA